MTKNKIIESIKNESLYFEDLDEIYKNDKEVVLTGVKQIGAALEYASQEIQDEIGENNPVKYLESYFLKQKLNDKLINTNKLVIRKIKI